MVGKLKRSVKNPKADAWDKLSEQEPGESIANRDVFKNQQLDRSKIKPRESRTGRTVLSIILTLFVFAACWAVVSFGESLLGFISGFGSPGEEWSTLAITGYILKPSLFKTWFSIIVAVIVFLVAYLRLMRNLDAQNLMNDTTDINQYQGDQHIALPDEIVRKFDWFPDVGAHSGVQVSSMISHVMLKNKGIKRVSVTRRAKKDVKNEDGDIEYLKGEALVDENGDPVTDRKEFIDEAFGDDLFDASGLPKDKKLRRRFVASEIEYNPDGENREKLGKYKTVADMINDDWELPEYETQRPAGAYLVDTAPVNTMVLAITRAGKGQTYIEPMIDMWLREKNPSNIVINDPKGELLVKHYVRATMRGFQVVQLNLINAMKTDIYNPLGLAAEAAREGDIIKCAQYVENIAEVFFPTNSGDDPFWANSANNAFKRVAYGLIDFYMEEERKMRSQAEEENWNPKVLETRLDEMWGKVTLYNCYQFFVQLTAKKQKNPMVKLDEDFKAGKYLNDDERYQTDKEDAELKEPFWDGAPSIDLLSLYFRATEELPTNSIRTLIMNANNSLKSMGGAEKTISTVYGIAITAMSFFTDPTIMSLTSGAPSQNIDLGGLSFPRRFGVRFSPDYLSREYLVGAQARWEAFTEDNFTTSLGEEFYHEDTVTRDGWARYYFAGKFATDNGYVRLALHNPQTGMLIKTYYFEFTKNYQTSLNGRHYMTDPITSQKLIKNGVLVELQKDETAGAYVPGHTVFPQVRLSSDPEHSDDGTAVKATISSRAITQTMARYSEQPKVIFLVTPPHLMKYAKLLLIFVKQLVDFNFDKSYMTKSNQKPLYKTRFMLDELGNLQSEGHGIAGFETMLSIGLGQEQQFTIILQTLQQLRDVYGESVDKIVQGNTSNIVFLKSTDDSMIDTLQRMSGTRHVVYRDSKTVTKDVEKIIKIGSIEGKVSYTMAAKEEPVISYNDMAFISERNSILFRAGDSPVWNRNETILPMSWRLFQDTITHPGHDYSLQSIPTLSSVADYDVRRNQPDFFKMLEIRMGQAVHANASKADYRKAFGYTDVDISRLDPDIYSDEVMGLINEKTVYSSEDSDDFDEELMPDSMFGPYEDNREQDEANRVAEMQQQEREAKRYAEGLLSRADLNSSLDAYLISAYHRNMGGFRKMSTDFSVGDDGSLLSADKQTVYMSRVKQSDVERLEELVEDEDSRVFAEMGGVADVLNHSAGIYQVEPAFYAYLGSLPSWQQIAEGRFDKDIAQMWRNKEAETLNE